LVVNIPLDKDWLNMRTFESMATRVPLVLNYDPANDYGFSDFFESGKHCLTYKTNDELKASIDLLLTDKKLYDEISDNTYKEVLKHHTYWHRMRKLIDSMGLQEKIKI